MAGDKDGPIAQLMPRISPMMRDWVYAHWDDQQHEVSRKALSRRLFDLRASEELGGMFDAEETNLDLAAELDVGKLVIVRLDKHALGKGETPIVATAFLATALMAMFSRQITDFANPPRDWRIILDELADMLPEGGLSVLKQFLVQARKFYVGLVMAFQIWSQVSGAVRDSLRTSAVKICARLDGAEATDMAERMGCSKAFLQSLRRVPKSHGEFAIMIEDRPQHAVRL